MRALEVKTVNKVKTEPRYTDNLKNVKVFLRHEEDSIVVKDGEMVYISIYHNGELIFNGSKLEFFEQLKK